MAKLKNFLSGVPFGPKPRTKKAMITYLSNHFRYDTQLSVNQSTSYAINVKVNNLVFADNEASLRAYDLLSTDDWQWDVNRIIREFNARHDHSYQIGWNGRSGGYLVLYKGGKKISDYKSHCIFCAQRNFKLVFPLERKKPKGQILALALKHPTAHSFEKLSENWPSELEETGVKHDDAKRLFEELSKERSNCTLDAKCGKCGEQGRVNYLEPEYEIFTYPRKAIDQYRDYEDWSIGELRVRVDLVWDFDKTANRVAESFVGFCKTHQAVEEQRMVPQTYTAAAPLN